MDLHIRWRVVRLHMQKWMQALTKIHHYRYSLLGVTGVVATVLFGEFLKPVVWKPKLVLQVVVAVNDGNLRVSCVRVNAEVHGTPPSGLRARESERLLCVLCGTVFSVLARMWTSLSSVLSARVPERSLPAPVVLIHAPGASSRDFHRVCLVLDDLSWGFAVECLVWSFVVVVVSEAS